MHEGVIPVLVLSGTVYAAYRFRKWQKTIPEKHEGINYVNVCRSVRTLSIMVDELESLEQIITDLQTCNADALKGVTISVLSATGKKNAYTVIADGENCSSQQLLAVAFSERDRKREDIRKAIEELHETGIVTSTYLSETESEKA